MATSVPFVAHEYNTVSYQSYVRVTTSPTSSEQVTSRDMTCFIRPEHFGVGLIDATLVPPSGSR